MLFNKEPEGDPDPTADLQAISLSASEHQKSLIRRHLSALNQFVTLTSRQQWVTRTRPWKKKTERSRTMICPWRSGRGRPRPQEGTILPLPLSFPHDAAWFLLASTLGVCRWGVTEFVARDRNLHWGSRWKRCAS